MATLQKSLEGFEAVRVDISLLRIADTEFHTQRIDNSERDILENGKTIVALAIVCIGPDGESIGDPDELRRYSNLIARSQNAAFEDVRYVQRAGDCRVVARSRIELI
jgi:hypothetical protein